MVAFYGTRCCYNVPGYAGLNMRDFLSYVFLENGSVAKLICSHINYPLLVFPSMHLTRGSGICVDEAPPLS